MRIKKRFCLWKSAVGGCHFGYCGEFHSISVQMRSRSHHVTNRLGLGMLWSDLGPPWLQLGGRMVDVLIGESRGFDVFLIQTNNPFIDENWWKLSDCNTYFQRDLLWVSMQNGEVLEFGDDFTQHMKIMAVFAVAGWTTVVSPGPIHQKGSLTIRKCSNVSRWCSTYPCNIIVYYVNKRAFWLVFSLHHCPYFICLHWLF